MASSIDQSGFYQSIYPTSEVYFSPQFSSYLDPNYSFPASLTPTPELTYSSDYTNPPFRDRSASTVSSLAPIPVRGGGPHRRRATVSGGIRKTSVASSRRPSKAMAESENTSGTAAQAADTLAAKKPKRVRTGCLTCRERHLKCDEGLPNCQNCLKSNRNCKRGVRLNFIDTKVEPVPILPQSHDWAVHFLDESREIASEYKGGLSKYSHLETDTIPNTGSNTGFDFSSTAPSVPVVPHQSLPPIQGMLPEPLQEQTQQSMAWDQPRQPQHHSAPSHSESTYTNTNLPNPPHSAYSNTERNHTPAEESRDYLTTQDEVLFMQVFVEEVGIWMDSMDPQKHV